MEIKRPEQLDALPEKSVIIADNGDPWVKGDDGWYWAWMDYGEPATEVPLPAILIHPSSISIDGVTQSWQQMYEKVRDENVQLAAYRTMLSDLDRNEHGRHQGDVDGSEPSKGNPHLETGQVLGYSLGGSWKYVVPPARLRGTLDAWRVRNDGG